MTAQTVLTAGLGRRSFIFDLVMDIQFCLQRSDPALNLLEIWRFLAIRKSLEVRHALRLLAPRVYEFE